MRATGERRTLESATTVEEQVQDLFHLFPYHYVRDLTTPDSRVLDLGFGEGYGARILSAAVSEYVGVDASLDAVEHARSNYQLSNVSFEQADAAHLPFPNDSFDLIVSFHVIEHLVEPQPYVAEMRRVCRAGGRVVVVTPNRAFRLNAGERPWNRFHVKEYDQGDLQAILSPQFATVTVLGVTGSPPMTTVERARVQRARRLARLDPLGLRYRLPERLLVHVRRLVSRSANRLQPSHDGQTFSIADVRCVESHLAGAVHLLAVAERGESDAHGKPGSEEQSETRSSH